MAVERLLYSGGINTFQRKGYPTPEGIEFPMTDYHTKLEQLRVGGAAEIVKNRKFGNLVAELLKTHSIKELDEASCKQFLLDNPEFKDYHPALVRATAEDLELERLAEKSEKNIKH